MLEIFEVNIDTIYQDDKNIKTHGFKSIDSIKKSIIIFVLLFTTIGIY